MKKLSPYLLFLNLLLSSCTYEPDGVAVTHVNPANPPIINISFDAMSEKDTIRLYEPTYLRYSIDGEIGRIIRVFVVFAGITVNQNAGVSGVINFSGSMLKPGTNKLTIGVVSATGSGSFADKVSEETFLQEKHVMINIDVRPPDPPINSFSSENGMLRISWERYRKPNFVKYMVQVTDPTLGGVSLIDIVDQSVSYYVDTQYFGGYNIEYTVGIKSTVGTVFSAPVSRSDAFNMDGFYNPADSTVSLSWDKADFPGSFKEYLIIENNVPIRTINDPNIESIKFKPAIAVFGASADYSVRIGGKSGMYIQSPKTLNVPRFVETLKFSIRPDKFEYSAYLNAAVSQTPSPVSLQVHDDNWRVIDTYPGLTSEFAIAANSPYFYTVDLTNKRVVETNLNTRQSTYLDIPPLPSHVSFLDMMSIVSVSSNRMVSYMYFGYNQDEKVINSYNHVYDFLNQKDMLGGAIIGREPLPFRLSDDGEYLLSSNSGEICSLMFPNCKGNVYKKINGTFERVRQLTANEGAFFRPGVSNEAFALNNGTLSVVKISTGETRHIIVPSGYSLVNFDSASGHFFFAKEGQYVCYAIHIDTMVRVEIAAYYHPINSKLTLHNGYVVDQLGNYFQAIK
ncbi:MAG: hypothetical protein ACK50M_14580 [Cyclobacteriaceae bacterium]